MKKLVLFLCLVVAGVAQSQDFTDKALQTPQIDEHGNVINNITDKQGLKQGDWFYLDVNGNQIAKKLYSNDNCQATFLRLNDKWLNTKDFSTNTKNTAGATAKLKSNGYELNKDKQVLLIFDNAGTYLSGYLLGNWNVDDEAKVLAILKSFFANQNIKSSTKQYILL